MVKNESDVKLVVVKDENQHQQQPQIQIPFQSNLCYYTFFGIICFIQIIAIFDSVANFILFMDDLIDFAGNIHHTIQEIRNSDWDGILLAIRLVTTLFVYIVAYIIYIGRQRPNTSRACSRCAGRECCCASPLIWEIFITGIRIKQLKLLSRMRDHELRLHQPETQPLIMEVIILEQEQYRNKKEIYEANEIELLWEFFVVSFPLGVITILELIFVPHSKTNPVEYAFEWIKIAGCGCELILLIILLIQNLGSHFRRQLFGHCWDCWFCCCSRPDNEPHHVFEENDLLL
ncbi:hypothetical protein DLAC_06369 [Tieghemostelium lacteum]|uniref:Transmembrane protein n=1 Tax=Tieghemostelium lacteum TaxID=361077 RepID=A0A151ZEP2_TIELA|nr:hypothetical protein DLAC_06369 [Tieghemostelium lacteum]|eukprot:KYQ92397.1 hypothetical protein DLAC_06369 [Tieghemostelium lacteum]